MEKKLRDSSVKRGELYARIRDEVFDFTEKLQKVISKEKDVFGIIELSFNRSSVHVDKITLADKPLLEMRREMSTEEAK